MVESNVVTVTYSAEIPPVVPPTEKIKCPFCDQTFDSYEELWKHISEAHQKEVAIIVIAIIIVIALIFWLARE